MFIRWKCIPYGSDTYKSVSQYLFELAYGSLHDVFECPLV